ncbi:MAG TPA: RNA 2',3'-cyclic phosphodiesterase [Bacteroidota bacterium]|nr:RNA 2',3'-cyclic phosphodiesterase [Bacteroidota bacterium]HXY54179.1 RNA 2',3'-cyclic phosphodiesterase [Nitrospirota bacterium]
MRTFIAVEIPDGIKKEMEKAQEQLKRSGADAGWTRPEGIHLTLKFLGEVMEAKIDEIKNTLTRAVGDMGRFRLEIGGAGAFPNSKNPRVVWLGVSGDIDKLEALWRSVEDSMTAIGFDREERAFSPHLTLARIKYLRPRFSWQKAIDGIKDIRLAGFEVDHISLMKSELKPSGAVYSEIARADLK